MTLTGEKNQGNDNMLNHGGTELFRIVTPNQPQGEGRVDLKKKVHQSFWAALKHTLLSLEDH